MADGRNLTESREQTKSQQLERRMLLFAANVIRILERHRSLPRPVSDQLTKAAGSIGANYAEACNAISKQDFRNKIFQSKKEAAEARCWIDLCTELSGPVDWIASRKEIQELLMILQTIVNNLRSGSAK